jgi:hypothetical protein
MSFGNAASKTKTKTKTLTDLIRVRGLWFYLVRRCLLLNRRSMRHVTAEFLPERLCVVRINPGVIASTRHRNVCHAAVEQSLSAQLGVHVNENTVDSLSLAGVCPCRKFCAAHGGCRSPNRTAKLQQFCGGCLTLVSELRRCTRVQSKLG